MDNEKYQEIKASMRCTHCCYCDNRNRRCLKKNKRISLSDMPCASFDMDVSAAWLYDIDTSEDYYYFHEQYRKEQNND